MYFITFPIFLRHAAFISCRRCFDHENQALAILESSYQKDAQRSCENHHLHPQTLKPIFRILKMLSCCKNPYGKESVYPITT